MSRFISVTLIFSILLQIVRPARILGVFPMPSVSHQVVFRALTLELAKRGHELVVITPDPALPKERRPDNITEIDTHSVYDFYHHVRDMMKGKRGVAVTQDMWERETMKMVAYFEDVTFEVKEVQDLINDKTQKFDLIIAEALFHMPLMFSKIYEAPTIWFSSLYRQVNNFYAVGAPTSHPFLYPHNFRDKFTHLSFWDKINQLRFEIRLWDSFRVFYELENEIIKKHFGDEAETVDELSKRVDLLFVNANPIFEGNRPVPSNVVNLGAFHLMPVKDLPQDLKSFLDSSSRGVIYVSLGTNVFPKMMDPELLDAFLDAFESLPYDIMWKFDGDDLPRKPTNLRIQKWFPQRDLLHHSNIKLFITQGGLQSTDEAIDATVPLVGIPILGDQWFNVAQYIRLGIGEQVDILTLTAETLSKAVRTVLGDISYRENMVKLRELIRDQPDTPIERAVWWTEYVLRHKGAKHLRSMAANMTWSQYLELDFVLKLFALVTVIVTFLIVSLRYAIRLIFVDKNKKLKKR